MQEEKMYNELVLLNQLFKPLYNKLRQGDFVQDKSGVKLVELIAPRLELDPMQPVLSFNGRRTNERYAKEEIAWYESMDLHVTEISKNAGIWNEVASFNKGKVNSNYGWCIWSGENHLQYWSAVDQLKENLATRRACMIYNRPSMQDDYNRDGMSDFICTFATQQLIRDGKLIYIVNMRSNDAIFGLFNDFYWHCYVYKQLLKDLGPIAQPGQMIWLANSIHVYERHFDLLKTMCTE